MSEAGKAIGKCYGAEEVAEALGVNIETVYRKMRSNEIQSYRVGRRRVIPESALLDYLQGSKLAPVVQLREIK